MLPLYPKTIKAPVSTGNQGLYFTKFVDKWPNGVSERLGSQEKQAWLKKFDKVVGVQKELTNARKRLCNLAAASGAQGQKPVELESQSIFVTGMGLEHPVENGFLWHHTLGVPYLPGSSIKGLVRAWALHWGAADGGLDEVSRLFGRETTGNDKGAAGCLIVFDALPTGPLRLQPEIITPHDDGWRIKDNATPSDWVSPVPIPFLVVAPKAEFCFALGSRQGAENGDVEKGYRYLKEALQWIGAGAKTSSGFGCFMSQEALQEEEDIIAALETDLKAQEEEIIQARPLTVGDKVFLVDDQEEGVIEAINGEMVDVWSDALAETVTVDVSELERR